MLVTHFFYTNTLDPKSMLLTGLTGGTTYQYRAVATNAGGLAYGSNLNCDQMVARCASDKRRSEPR